MENLIHNDRKLILLAAAFSLFTLFPAATYAQSAAEKALLEKARSLESSGRLDMAAQTWEQVLLVDANNKEALLGIARADMRLGKTQEARRYLDRLKAAGGTPDAISSVEKLSSVQPQSVQLQQATQLSRQGRYADAMRIYRDLYGGNPPAGDIALSYYDTEAAIPSDRAHAIAGLRQLARQFPADSRYAITLGRVLTYDQSTRAEGISILNQYPNVVSAKNSLRQAEIWNTKPPAGTQEQADQPSAPVAVTSPEALAYRALNSGRLDEAKTRFQAIFDRQPNNRDALAGLGYVAMKQQDFATAQDYLERARAAGAKNVASTLSSAQFWLKMTAAENELKAGNSDAAIAGYRSALQIQPNNASGLEGLGGALLQAEKNDEAIAVFEQAARADPQHADAWRGLFLAQTASGNAQAALDLNDRIPKNIRPQLAKDPDYLRALAQNNLAIGKKDEADRVIAQALALPFPNGGRDLPVQKQMQYASLLMTAKKYDPAIRLYQQIVDQSPDNGAAWNALISAQHEMHADNEAIATIGRMPQPVFEKQQNDPAFLTLIGSIYQSRHDYTRAQKYLERAAASAPARTSTTLQLADVYAAQGDAQKAYAIYVRERDQNQSNLQAWRGVLNSLHLMNRDRDALRQIAAMPEFVHIRLEQDPAYLQVLASIQTSAGQSRAALQTFDQISQIYARQSTEVPVDVRIQYGWVLLKAGDERRLYSLISSLSSTTTLTDDQQTDLNNLWASWSMQRANAALAAGDQRRALTILVAAAQAFPQNEDIYSTLAGAYMKTGQPKQAMAIYAARNMDNATVQQFQGAIGAAMSANDLDQVQRWLTIALDRFKDNASILRMAAQYEQARGDSARAAAYYRAALNAAGPVPFGGDLLPQPGEPTYNPSPMQQLMQLLAPPGPSARLEDLDLPYPQDQNTSPDDAPRSPTLGDYADGNALPTTAAPQRDSFSNRADDRTAALDSRTAALDSPDSSFDLPPVPQTTRRENTRGRNLPVIRSQAAPPVQLPVVRPSSSPVELATREAPSITLRPIPTPVAPLPTRTRAPEIRSENDSLQLRPAVHSITAQPETAQVYAPNNPSDSQIQPPQQQSRPQYPLSTPSVQLPLSPGYGTPSAIDRWERPAALPPLTGPKARVARPKTEREQIEEQLAILEGASSNWVGGSSAIDYRSGQPGYDRFAVFSTPIEASTALTPNVRATFIVKPVLLDAGNAADSTTRFSVPYQLGTLVNVQDSNGLSTNPPEPQTASGIGGEIQLRTPSFAAMLGYSPYGFLVENVIGGLYIHPPASHFTLTFGRDSIVDTQLAYSGLRDLGSRGPNFAGNYWGGVIANSGELQLSFGNERSGWYIQGGGQYITGRHVQTNKRIDGDAGAYWSVWHRPDIGSLTLGLNFFGMHYDHNLRYFTYGQGGYFSPGSYMLTGIPFTFSGARNPRFHYRVTGSLGVQAFEEDATPFYPIDPVLQAARSNPWYPAQTNVSGNYNLTAEGSYAIAEHWYVGGYLSFNNSRNYSSNNVGFYVRYLFHPQPINVENGPTGIFPVRGLRPLNVP